MQVGDLVKYRDNGAIGLVMKKSQPKNAHYHVLLDGQTRYLHESELEVINASR
jgi:hypothetical protein